MACVKCYLRLLVILCVFMCINDHLSGHFCIDFKRSVHIISCLSFHLAWCIMSYFIIFFFFEPRLNINKSICVTLFEAYRGQIQYMYNQLHGSETSFQKSQEAQLPCQNLLIKFTDETGKANHGFIPTKVADWIKGGKNILQYNVWSIEISLLDSDQALKCVALLWWCCGCLTSKSLYSLYYSQSPLLSAIICVRCLNIEWMS